MCWAVGGSAMRLTMGNAAAAQPDAQKLLRIGVAEGGDGVEHGIPQALSGPRLRTEAENGCADIFHVAIPAALWYNTPQMRM